MAKQSTASSCPSVAVRVAVPSIAQQTGWKRPYPKMICQDINVLQRVTEYDFDLNDATFARYAEQRCGRGVAGIEGSVEWRFTGDYSKGRAEFMNNFYFRFTQPIPPGSGKRRKLTDEEMESRWKWIGIARAKLQDAWEIYRTTVLEKDLSLSAHQGGRDHG
jgi:hypothetical protein